MFKTNKKFRNGISSQEAILIPDFVRKKLVGAIYICYVLSMPF